MSGPLPGAFAQGEGGDTEIRLELDMASVNELDMIVYSVDDQGAPQAVFPTTNSLSGTWTDLYQWSDLGNTYTTTLESLVGPLRHRLQ